jgi:hypothetical protein
MAEHSLNRRHQIYFKDNMALVKQQNYPESHRKKPTTEL